MLLFVFFFLIFISATEIRLDVALLPVLNPGKVYYSDLQFSSLIGRVGLYSTLARSITVTFNFPLSLVGCGLYSAKARSLTQ